MENHNIDIERPSFWQQIFLQSKVNGAPYHGELLPGRDWNWPKDSYLKRRLKHVRSYRPADERSVSPYDLRLE
jgi:hypothetical protein